MGHFLVTQPTREQMKRGEPDRSQGQSSSRFGQLPQAVKITVHTAIQQPLVKKSNTKARKNSRPGTVAEADRP